MGSGGVCIGSMAYERVGRVLLLCAGSHPSTDEEVQLWLERLARHDYDSLLLSIRGPSGMNPKQRARIAEFWQTAGRSAPRTALVTDSGVTRMVMTAINWLTRGETRTFAPDEWHRAAEYLSAADAAQQLRTAADHLHRQVRVASARPPAPEVPADS